MATSEAVYTPVAPLTPAQAVTYSGPWICAALTLAAVLIHGYHPYAEDGGVYLAGIKRTLDPHLYPAFSGFVTAHLHFSLFAPLIATCVRVTRLSLMAVLFVAYVATTWLTLLAGWLIAVRITSSQPARLGAVGLLAALLTIPIAGTSLMLMDPYVTARSISTPCGLLAIVGGLDLVRLLRVRPSSAWRAFVLILLTTSIAFAMHPLMAGLSLGFVLLLLCFSLSGRRLQLIAAGGFCGLSLLLAGYIEKTAYPATPDYARIALTRGYWFLSNWQWYELLGLIAPPMVIVLCQRHLRAQIDGDEVDLASPVVAASGTGLLCALLFCHVHSHTYMIARLQPLRIYQTVYILMILELGAALGAQLVRHHPWQWMLLGATLSTGMAAVQIYTFPHSEHLEFPWSSPQNLWTQAFEWIRTNTPQDAVFALDPHYTSATGEDAQNFRAIAERSALPDYAKDGGIASIDPRLQRPWTEAELASTGLDDATGSQLDRVRALGVNWLVLAKRPQVNLDCAYHNAVAWVCRLPH